MGQSILLIESLEQAESNRIYLFVLFLLVMLFLYLDFWIFLLDIFLRYRFIEKISVHTKKPGSC
jgi:hypothetical protein